MMKALFDRLYQTFFREDIDFHARNFNLLALAGVLVSFCIGTGSLFTDDWKAAAACYFLCAFAVALLIYSSRTEKYKRCYYLTIGVIFLAGFSVIFFLGGGFLSGMPLFFVFAVVFTAFLLEGRELILMSAVELMVYSTDILLAWRFPQWVIWHRNTMEIAMDVLICTILAAVSLGASAHLQVKQYRTQQLKLDEQNAMLAQMNQSKTEFLANASHEMRTPLTVVSVNIQMVMELLKRMDGLSDGQEPVELLADAQEEIMRLARMVDGMLMLNAASGTGEAMEKTRLDLSALLYGVEDVMRLVLDRQGNRLQTEIQKELILFGNMDLLTQVIINLIENADKHTRQDVVRLCAKEDAGEITVTVRDNGSGISPELLPHVFERGVSDGGTGFGLFLSKMAVESHGGTIRIASEPGKGTEVTITLPVYQGQFGGNGK